MAKFRANHAASVANIDQAAGVAQFTNQRAADSAAQALRGKVQIRPAASFRLDQASATVRTKSGGRFDADIAHAKGTEANPMSDAALITKFNANAKPVIGPERLARRSGPWKRLPTPGKFCACRADPRGADGE